MHSSFNNEFNKERLNSHPALSVYEWSIVLLFCFILLLLSLHTLKKTESDSLLVETKESKGKIELLSIRVEGAVLNAGVYKVKKQSSLKGAINQAELLPSADLSQINMKRRLSDGDEIYIPYRYPITIHVSGAVKEEGEMGVLSGTRYSAFADQLDVLPGADLRTLRRKKGFIKENEQIHVPTFKRTRKK